MESMAWLQILDDFIRNSLRANAHWKDNNKSVLPTSKGKYLERLISFALTTKRTTGKEISDLKPAFFHLKYEIIPYPPFGKGFG